MDGRSHRKGYRENRGVNKKEYQQRLIQRFLDTYSNTKEDKQMGKRLEEYFRSRGDLEMAEHIKKVMELHKKVKVRETISNISGLGALLIFLA